MISFDHIFTALIRELMLFNIGLAFIYEAPKRTKLLYAQISMLICNEHTNACYVEIKAFKVQKIHPEMQKLIRSTLRK